MSKFNYDLDFDSINFREQPELYRVGKGEQGVLKVEPYKSEILPHWRFKTPDIAEESSAKILEMFYNYLDNDDFVGADMARKFLQMGWTRSRRYANHKGGKKYKGEVPQDKKGQSGAHGREEKPREIDEEKAKSAEIFYEKYVEARENEKYKEMKEVHKEKHESSE